MVTKPKDKITIVVFSGELDKALAAFTIATAAAAMEMEVNMMFTFWGLNVIKKKGGFLKGKSWMQKMLSVMNYGHAQKLALSKLHMAGMGTAMMGQMMKMHNIPSLKEMIEIGTQLGINYYPCEMSMTMMGIEQKDFIDEAKPVIGAVTYLDMAKDSKINLFI